MQPKKGDFLRQRITRQLFPLEQYLPSDVMDRGSLRLWEEQGKPDAFQRASLRRARIVGELSTLSTDRKP